MSSNSVTSKADYCVYSDDLEKVIRCKSCDKELTYGQSYTSKNHLTSAGFGYCICEECMEKEWKERHARK